MIRKIENIKLKRPASSTKMFRKLKFINLTKRRGGIAYC